MSVKAGVIILASMIAFVIGWVLLNRSEDSKQPTINKDKDSPQEYTHTLRDKSVGEEQNPEGYQELTLVYSYFQIADGFQCTFKIAPREGGYSYEYVEANMSDVIIRLRTDGLNVTTILIGEYISGLTHKPTIILAPNEEDSNKWQDWLRSGVQRSKELRDKQIRDAIPRRVLPPD